MLVFNMNNQCAKCGKRDASVRWNGTIYDQDRYPGGLIERKCGLCGYVWTELPLDAVVIDKSDKTTINISPYHTPLTISQLSPCQNQPTCVDKCLMPERCEYYARG